MELNQNLMFPEELKKYAVWKQTKDKKLDGVEVDNASMCCGCNSCNGCGACSII